MNLSGTQYDAYDYVFSAATSMEAAKFTFKHDNKEFMLRAWKGDYTNLGDGAERGIYQGKEPYWLTGVDYAMPMTLQLLNQRGKQIFNWTPDEPNWWITGFDPSRQNVSAKSLDGRIDYL